MKRREEKRREEKRREEKRGIPVIATRPAIRSWDLLKRCGVPKCKLESFATNIKQ